MKTINVEYFSIHEFVIPDKTLIETVLTEIKSLDTPANINSSDIKQLNTTINLNGLAMHVNMPVTSSKILNRAMFNKELFTYLNAGLSEVKSLQYVDDVDFVITDCWATKTTKFQRHHGHTHPNSIISGIIYLTDHPAATTDFYLPNPWHWTSPLLRIGKGNSSIPVASIAPSVGKVVLFPSNLKHDTKPNLSIIPRYTISFNAFLSGNIGTSTTLLNVASVGIEDLYKN